MKRNSQAENNRATSRKLLEALCLATSALAEAYAATDPEEKPSHVDVDVDVERDRSRVPTAAQPLNNKSRRGGEFAGETLWVYCAGTIGLERLASSFGQAVFKIGTTTGSVRTRLQELSNDFYASCRSEADLEGEPGFDGWKTVRIVARKSTDPALSVGRHLIEVRLPATLTPTVVESRMRNALEPLCLNNLSDRTRDGGSGLTRWSCPPGRRSRATELYVFRPREDGNVLLEAIEGILAEHRAEMQESASRAPLASEQPFAARPSSACMSPRRYECGPN